MKKILIVDDDNELRNNLDEILKSAGYKTCQAASGREAIEKSNEDYDLILLDLIMPKMSGIDVLTELREVTPRSRIIMLTAFATIDNAVDVIKRGASDYIAKPFKIDELLARIGRVLEEASFDSCGVKGDLNCIFSSLSNPIRRKIIHIMSIKKIIRLMELVRELNIEDHTKVIFHMKILREAGIVEQDKDRCYAFTKDGDKIVHCLKILEAHLASLPSCNHGPFAALSHPCDTGINPGNS